MTTIELSSIGIIHTPFYSQAGTPVQPAFGGDTEGRVVVDRPYVSGLADLGGFERIWLLFHLHRSVAWKPRVVPYRDVQERGLFATRAPARPSPITPQRNVFNARVWGGLNKAASGASFVQPWAPVFSALLVGAYQDREGIARAFLLRLPVPRNMQRERLRRDFGHAT